MFELKIMCSYLDEICYVSYTVSLIPCCLDKHYLKFTKKDFL